jgi:hypothetical protein
MKWYPINKQLLTYHAKWQIGFFITTPCMYLFSDVLQWPHWATVIAFQFIGACIFWPVDNWIFRRKNKGKTK